MDTAHIVCGTLTGRGRGEGRTEPEDLEGFEEQRDALPQTVETRAFLIRVHGIHVKLEILR